MFNRPKKITQLEKIPKASEVIIPKENLDISVLTILVSSVSSVTPEQKRINLKNESKETAAVSNIRKEPIQETVNSIKISRGFFNAPRKRNSTQNVLTVSK